MKRRTKRDLIDAGLCGLVIVCLFFAGVIVNKVKSTGPRQSSMKLEGKNGQCSGVQIKAKSGKEYILSAGHCAHLSDDKTIKVTDESGRILSRQIIAEDQNSDLLLIEAVPGTRSIEIDDKDIVGQKVETFTHGSGLDTYRTSGELIQFKEINIPLYPIETPEQDVACKAVPKNRVDVYMMFGEPFIVCSMHLDGVVSTAKVVPGSSGGMVVHDKKLVGIVSATSSDFAFFVSLKDIHQFVDNY